MYPSCDSNCEWSVVNDELDKKDEPNLIVCQNLFGTTIIARPTIRLSERNDIVCSLAP